MNMYKKEIKLSDLPKVEPFGVPEGYFEGLTNSIMANLPERVSETPKTVSLWGHLQPWMYMAAMFIGIALMVKVFVQKPQQAFIKTCASEGLNLTSSSDIDDYYNYYENSLAKIVYDDAFYLTDYIEDFSN
jgi:hypothetical protein